MRDCISGALGRAKVRADGTDCLCGPSRTALAQSRCPAVNEIDRQGIGIVSVYGVLVAAVGRVYEQEKTETAEPQAVIAGRMEATWARSRTLEQFFALIHLVSGARQARPWRRGSIRLMFTGGRIGGKSSGLLDICAS